MPHGGLSLWLHPQRHTVAVRLKRFAHYPHYLESLKEHLYARPLPERAAVSWRPYDAFTQYLIEADDEDQAQEIESFIDDVADMIRRGEDVPPLVVDGAEIVDGRHRAFAAERLGLELAPVIDLASL